MKDYGKVGDAIDGSRFFRDFCYRCHEPIRVLVADGHNQCERCKVAWSPEPKAVHLTPRQAVKMIG
jgi:hypothetical protein